MAKETTDDLKSISVFFLNKHGFLDGGICAGSIQWMVGDKRFASVKVAGIITEDFAFVRINYWLKEVDNEKRLEYIHEIQLTSTPCFFGNERYWFTCPLCKGRSALLYLNLDVLGCRKCFDLRYESQKYRWDSYYSFLNKVIGPMMDAEKEISTLRVKSWRGRPTARYARLLKQLNVSDSDLEILRNPKKLKS